MLLSISFSFGQVALRKSSLSSGGGSASSGSLYMVYAIGEIGVQENADNGVHLSEGFVGPDISALVGIEEYSQLEGVNIFPNPVKNDLNIELPDYQNYEVHIYDLTGKEIFNKNIEDDNHAKYDLSNFKTGIYILAIVDRENKKAKTIKIQKM